MALNRIARILLKIKTIPERIFENELILLRSTINKLSYDYAIRELHHRILYLEGKSDKIPTMERGE
jgi:hypothetical protein